MSANLPIQLKGITWDHSRGYDPLIACSNEYSKSTSTNISWKKRSLKDFGDMSLEQLANEYDLLIIDHPHSGVAMSSECILPLENLIDSSHLATLREQSTGPSFDSYNYQGHQWALPIDAAMQTAVYRSDKLTTEIPKTWQQVLDHKNVGMALCPTDSLCSFLSLAAQFDDTQGMCQQQQLISTNVGVKILTLLKALKGCAHPESTQWNPIDLFNYMSEEDDIHYAPLAFSYTNYSRIGYRRKLLTFTNVPELTNSKTGSKSAVLGGAGIAISAQCKYPKEAAEFAQWICSAHAQTSTYTENQGQPANIIAWENKHSNEVVNNFFSNTLATIQNAFVRPRFAQWPKFQEHLGDVVHDYLVNPTDEKQVIDYLNQSFIKLNET